MVTAENGEKTDENSGHYVIASSRPPERRAPTAGTSHARAKNLISWNLQNLATKLKTTMLG